MSETPRTDALRRQFEYWTNATDRFHDEEQEKFWKMVEEMERAIAKGTTWIPVSERLPSEERVECLTYSSRWDYQVRLFETKGTYRGFCWRDEEGEHVTHWMPLPEAPK